MLYDPTVWLLLLLGVTVLLAAFMFWRCERLMAERAGRILFLITLLLLPLGLLRVGVAEGIEQSKERSFCKSCHEMEPYERSLAYQDREFLPAGHVQERRVDADKACYSCHTDYGMFGGMKAKLNGMKHVMVHFFGEVPEKGEIELYEPYPNENCLHCHEGQRSFETEPKHDTKKVSPKAIHDGETSCMSSGCHDLAHAIGDNELVRFWQPENEWSKKVLKLPEVEKKAAEKDLFGGDEGGGGDDGGGDIFDDEDDEGSDDGDSGGDIFDDEGDEGSSSSSEAADEDDEASGAEQAEDEDDEASGAEQAEDEGAEAEEGSPEPEAGEPAEGADAGSKSEAEP